MIKRGGCLQKREAALFGREGEGCLEDYEKRVLRCSLVLKIVKNPQSFE